MLNYLLKDNIVFPFLVGFIVAFAACLWFVHGALEFNYHHKQADALTSLDNKRLNEILVIQDSIIKAADAIAYGFPLDGVKKDKYHFEYQRLLNLYLLKIKKYNIKVISIKRGEPSQFKDHWYKKYFSVFEEEKPPIVETREDLDDPFDMDI